MLIICAWCDRPLGTKPPLDDQAVTHGICAACSEQMLEDHRVLQEATTDAHSD